MAHNLIAKIFYVFFLKSKSVILSVLVPVLKLDNHRQKMMGYNAAKELYRRVQENLMRGGEDDDE